MADLPEQGSPAPEDRLATYFGGGSDAEQPEAAPVEEAATEEPDYAVESDEPNPDLVEEEVDGVVLRGNKEAVERLKSERASKQDYTVKTQEAANLRRAAEDRLQFAEAREQIMSQVMQDVAAINAKRDRLQQLSSLDLGQLYNADPAQMFNVQRQIDTLKSEIADAEKQVAGKVQSAKAMIDQHRGRQWQLAVEGAKQRLGSVTPEDDAAMLRQVQSLGFDTEELQGRFADPRFLQLVFKAAKWDAIQGGKTHALSSVSKAPPVLKPGAVTNASAVTKEKALRQQLRTKGDTKTAARLLAKFM